MKSARRARAPKPVPAANTGLQKQIRAHILERIRAREWAPGDRIPSENELVRLFGVSRMTVHHALKDLRNEGYLTRTKGVGTFAAPPRAHVVVTRLQDIAIEIQERGGEHDIEVLTREVRAASMAEAALFGLEARAKLLHLLLLHRENGLPVQLEDRLVNPALVPGVLKIDPGKETFFSFLMRRLPYPAGKSIIRAIAPDELTRQRLQLELGEPCLEIERITYLDDRVVTAVRLIHPASRYALTGEISPP